ncbi:hypothetical protein C8N46_105244 [Kordia periserrulae]|uniref:Uncharacterized protein n=1 Tax=Kordia periserrulae TaxID=701523 RepID=A0A2T6BYG6_9FLAO|nr:hypothetical protein [Kordia periserrulae]PTX61088.1 hypothetical protein C8N46_105244 [Kordia periserrulae]
MKLTRGMRVFGHIDDLSSQIQINTGTREVLENNGVKYFEGSFIPLQTWRTLSTSELKKIDATGETFANYSKNIYIGEVSKKIKDAFMLLDLYNCRSPDEVFPRFKARKKEVKKINTVLHEFLKKCSSTGNFKFHKITRALPNQETMTSFHVEGEFLHLGLHIDQSRHFKIHTAYKSGNRITINLSYETRSLIFTNLTMIQAYNLIRKKVNVKKIILNPDTIAMHFYRLYPDYPVLKLDLKPFQYYVAPTDNFFHDGSTMGTKYIDITIVYTGQFDQLP